MASSLFRQNTQPPMNNPLQAMMEAMRTGKSPQQVLPQLAQSNPVVQQAMDIIRNKRPEEVTALIQQKAQERGVNVGQMLQQMGITPPK